MADQNIPSSLLPNEAIPNFEQMSAEAAQAQALAPTGDQQPVQQQSSGYTVPLLQNQSNTVLPISQDDADVAIRSGLYSPKNDQEFIVLDKYGNRNVVQGTHVRQALNEGLRLESTQERHEREIQEKYGNDEIAAGLEGAGRGALDLAALGSKAVAQIPGLEGAEFTSDDAMSGLSKLVGDEKWVNKQAMRDRAEANPIASAIGNVVGTISGGEIAGAGKLASGAEKVVAKTILKDAAKAGLPTKIAASIASKTVGGAVEGAYYGTGELLSEESLGKADFNAENLLVAAGMGAVLGGTLSGGMQAIVETAKSVAPLAKLAASPLTNKVSNATDAKVSSSRILGISPTQLRKLEDLNPKLVDDIQTYLKDDLKLSLTDTAEDLAAKNASISKTSGQKIESVLNELNSVLENHPELRPSAEAVWGNVYKKIFTKFEDFFSDVSAPGASTAKRQLTKFLDEVDALSKTGKEFNASDLQKIKRMEDKLLNWEKSPGKWTVQDDAKYIVRQSMKEEIDLLAHGLQSRGLADNLASQLKAANRQYSAAATFGDYIETRALKAADRDFSFMNSVRDAGLDISRKLVVLGKIEKAQISVDKMVNGAVKGFFEPATKVAQKAIVPFSIENSEFAKKFEDGKYKKPKNSAEAFVNLNENINRYSQDPEAFLNRVNRSTASIYKQAPNTSSALDTLSVQAAMFVASKVPKQTSAKGMLDMFRKPRPPSQLDLSKLERYLNAVENPSSVFEDMKAGKLSHEGAETLRAVYPTLFSNLQSKAMEQIGKNPQMAYNKKLQLGILLDIPTDESLIPENVIGLQSSFSAQDESEDGAVKPTQAGIKNLNSAERQATDTQSLDEL